MRVHKKWSPILKLFPIVMYCHARFNIIHTIKFKYICSIWIDIYICAHDIAIRAIMNPLWGVCHKTYLLISMPLSYQKKAGGSSANICFWYHTDSLIWNLWKILHTILPLVWYQKKDWWVYLKSYWYERWQNLEIYVFVPHTSYITLNCK